MDVCVGLGRTPERADWVQTTEHYTKNALTSPCSSDYLIREPAEEGAVCAERCCSSAHQHTASRPHHYGIASTPLAASTETSAQNAHTLPKLGVLQ